MFVVSVELGIELEMLELKTMYIIKTMLDVGLCLSSLNLSREGKIGSYIPLEI